MSTGTPEGFIAVVGGVNMDIGGRSFHKLIPADSNPGKIWMSPGGVGRNIAHNLRLLDVPVKLFSGVGDDLYGRQILKTCRQTGMDVSHVLCIPDVSTSAYLFVNGPEGEMALAVSDMEICSCLTPDYIEKNLDMINAAEAIVADANLPEETIRYLAGHAKAPVFADPVSVAKAARFASCLAGLHVIKPNRLEAELLSGIRITDDGSLRLAAEKILEKGVCQIYISLGKEGVLAADGEQMLRLPVFPTHVRNVTGAGDAFMAGLCRGYLEGCGLKETAEFSLAAASVAAESERTIAGGLSVEAVRKRMQTR